MKRITILTDDHDRYLISMENLKNYTSMDIGKIKGYFESKGYAVKIIKYADFDFSGDFSGDIILYQTSEAPGGFYKHYIEDIIFHLENRGAIVLPPYKYLKAHHNKVFMEMVRSVFVDESLKTIRSVYFGSEEEAIKRIPSLPVIVKRASGAGSSGVFLARNKDEYRKRVHEACETVIDDNLKNLIKNTTKNKMKQLASFVMSRYKRRIAESISRPIVVQNYIEGLKGDYKVLFFGNKYYTLYRENRENDFRASGSGRLFEVPEVEHAELLNFARKITFEIDFPVIGMDICFDGNNYHLLEFQMIHIGPYTLQAACFWHEFIDNKWVRFEGKSSLEEEYSRSIYQHIEKLRV